MTRINLLTLSDIVGLLNVNSLYFLSFSWLFGQSVWVSFFGGIIAHKALPRQQFSNLQAKSFPVYFSTSLAHASLLLALWISNNPQILHHLAEPRIPAVAQTWILAFTVIMTLANWLWIGPTTNQIILERQKQERAEGKPYYDAKVSDEMKALNRRFGQYHGLSSLANLFTCIALLFHGLWVANVGLRKDW